MRTLGAVCVLVASAALAVAAEPWAGKTESAFVPGGRINLELGGAGYTLKAGARDKIVVSYRVNDQDELKLAKAAIDVAGSVANIKVSGPHSGFEVVIEIPARSDLYIRLMAGELNVEGIRGNKDIESHAGEVNIDVGDPTDYGHVDASVTTGDLEAPAFNISKAGMFRSFHQNGPGQFRLHAHVGAGDLNLTSSGGADKTDTFI